VTGHLNESTFMTLLKITALLLLGSTLGTATAAGITPVVPVVDTSTLPALPAGWAELNPLRGNAIAATVGRSAFNQSCATCHGMDADGSRAPAPDLRRIGRACGRVRDAALHQRCLSDADHFFLKSVLKGKQKFGIEHMPAWEGVLDPAVVWSLRSFIETTGRP
jgi:mono/diheme cytochrome c family protein